MRLEKKGPNRGSKKGRSVRVAKHVNQNLLMTPKHPERKKVSEQKNERAAFKIQITLPKIRISRLKATVQLTRLRSFTLLLFCKTVCILESLFVCLPSSLLQSPTQLNQLIMPRSKRNTPFQPGHGLFYGLRPVNRDPETNAVISVACRFCEKFGREERVGAKRRATQRIKHFRQPFRTENYHQHHLGQHRIRWTEYKHLSPERKVAYLASPASPATDAFSHMENVISNPSAPASQKRTQNVSIIEQDISPVSAFERHFDEWPIKFIIDRPIVDVIIGEILLDPAEISKERAIASFTTTNASTADYIVSIKNIELFDLTVQHVRLGATPKTATAFIAEIVKSSSPANGTAHHLEECSEAKVSAYIRCVIAFNLQALTDLLRSTWAFSLCLERAQYSSNWYTDVSVRFCVIDDIHKYHLISYPNSDQCNMDSIYKSLSRVLEVLCSNWRDKLIGLSIDGSELAHSALVGIVDRIRVDSTTNLIRTWSGAYQLDRIMKSVYRSALDESFYDTLSTFIAYLRKQDTLISELQSICPKVASSTNWLSVENALRWIKAYRLRILQHLDDKKPGCSPGMSWWVMAMAVYEMTHTVSKTYNRIRGSTIFIAQQNVHLSELLQSLNRLSGCKGPVTEEELSLVNEWDRITRNKYVAQKSVIRNFLSGLGSFVHISMSELPEATLNGVVQAVGTMFLSAIVDLSSVIEGRGEFSVGAFGLPPVLPHELIKLTRASFNGDVRNQAHRLSTTFTPAEIEQIEEEFGGFLEGYHREETLQAVLRAVDPCKDFARAWGCLRGRFRRLFMYCGGLGSAYPGESSISTQFPVHPARAESIRITGLPDFSLEGSLHCAQYNRLRSLLEQVGA